MLNLMKLLTKLCGRVNYRTVDVTATSETSINANATAWVTVPKPPSGTPIGIVGYYIDGTAGNSKISVYAMRMLENAGQLAVRNNASSEASIRPHLYYLVVD